MREMSLYEIEEYHKKERMDQEHERRCKQCDYSTVTDIGYAKRLLKQGKKVARAGWNGKGMYLVLFSESNFCRKNTDDLTPEGKLVSYDFDIDDDNDNPIWHMGLLEDEKFYPLQDFVLLKTAKNTCIPWNASQEDLQAEDYIEID
jgi:hypothetical protein